MIIDRLLEYVEELSKIPLFAIEDLESVIDILESYNYTCYISDDTDYLIVKGVI